MIVRTFAQHDAAPASALTNTFIERSHIHFGTQPATEAQFRAMWLAGSAKFPWIAAEEGGRFAGYAKAGVWRDREAYNQTVEVGIYVEPWCQRRGAGRALYTELFTRLRQAGIHAVVAGIALPNDASVAMHEACGFRHVGTFKEVGRKFGKWWDVGFWQVGL